GRRGSDAQINQAQADRERAIAQQYAARSPKEAQQHLNAANAAQKKADTARADVDRATQALNDATSFLNVIVPASETTAEARAFRGSPGDVAGAMGPQSGSAPAPGASPAAPPAPGAPAPGAPAAQASVPTDPRAFQQYLNATYGEKLTVDGIIGPKTRA